MRIAFASSDGKVVDQHFGAAERFYLWDIGPERAEAVGRVVLGADDEEREDKIVARATALNGCTMVYTTQIGGPAAAKLVGRHIHPTKTAPNTPIADAIAQLQSVLRGKPPPWLRKAAGMTSNAFVFDEMHDE
jgi:nitrogen fixation protein NifX